MNSVQIIGNLTRDVQMRATKTGKSVAAFSVAVNRMYTMPNGEQKQLTDFVNVTAWGALAEAAANQLRKATRVFVEGRYTSRSYETQNGEKRYVTEVTANIIAIPLATVSTQSGSGDFSQFGNPQSEPVQYEQEPFPQTQKGQHADEDIPF